MRAESCRIAESRLERLPSADMHRGLRTQRTRLRGCFGMFISVLIPRTIHYLRTPASGNVRCCVTVLHWYTQHRLHYLFQQNIREHC